MRGRKKKYKTAKELRQAVQSYFDSISCMESIKGLVETDELDEYGHKVRRLEEVKNALGDVIRVRVFYVPPERFGLTEYLGISIDTWARYAEDLALAEVVAWAEEQIEGWKTRELLQRENKRTAGLIWEMERNHRRKQSDENAGSSATPLVALTDAQLLALASQTGEG